ncbi:MAG: DUF1127 domain-containing protein [Rhodobacteraceae bacterium]|nr:DUF1127 domain-containing protein [Paracoccaceae bacterium]
MFTSVHTAEATLHRLSGARKMGVFARLMAAQRLHRELSALSKLEDRLLDDVGLSRSDAMAQVQRPFWDVPAHWRA